MHRMRFAAPLAFALVFAGPSYAESNATKDEAMAMVKKGVAFIRANGKDKGYAKKIEPKQMYCEKLDDTAVCGGIYK